MFKLVHFEARTVSKWAFGITGMLSCGLVNLVINIQVTCNLDNVALCGTRNYSQPLFLLVNFESWKLYKLDKFQ